MIYEILVKNHVQPRVQGIDLKIKKIKTLPSKISGHDPGFSLRGGLWGEKWLLLLRFNLKFSNKTSYGEEKTGQKRKLLTLRNILTIPYFKHT